MINRMYSALLQIATLCALSIILLGCPSPNETTPSTTDTSSSTGTGGGGGSNVCTKNSDGCSTSSTVTTTTTTTGTTTSSTGTTGGDGGSDPTTTTTGNGGAGSGSGSGGEGGVGGGPSTTTGVGGEGGVGGGDPTTGSGSSVATGSGGAGGADPVTSSSATTGVGGAGGQGGDPQSSSVSSGVGGAGGVGGGVLGFGPWTQYNDPDLSANYTGLHAQAVSATDFYVLGQEQNGDGRIQHFDGTGFVPQTLPAIKFPRRMRAIGSDLFVFGAAPAFDCRIAQRGANNTWSTVQGTPTILGGGCVDAYGQDTDDMFLIASGPMGLDIYRGPKNGPWAPMTLPVTTYPVGPAQVWGSSSSDVYVVGYYYDNGVAGGALLHYNGSTWSAIQVDPSIENLLTVSGSGPNNVAVAGVTNAGKGVIVYFNGQSWSNPVLQNEVDVITDMVVRAPNEFLAVGRTNSPFNTAKVGAGNESQGFTWSIPAAQYGNLNGIVAVPGSELVLVVGDSVNGGQAFSAICN